MSYLSNPPQSRCMNCGRFWFSGKEIPDCVAYPKSEEIGIPFTKNVIIKNGELENPDFELKPYKDTIQFPTPTEKEVKAWIVMNRPSNKPAQSIILENFADCACQAMTYDGASIFKKKKDAMEYCYSNQYVIPCIITYHLPTNKKKK